MILGALTGQAIAPVIMNDKQSNLPILNASTTCPLIIPLLSSWFILKSATPPSPPSRSAEKLLCEKPPSMGKIFQNLMKILQNYNVVTLMICQGLGAGLMNTLLSQLNQLMCSRNYSIKSSTLTAVLNIIVGFFGKNKNEYSLFSCSLLPGNKSCDKKMFEKSPLIQKVEHMNWIK